MYTAKDVVIGYLKPLYKDIVDILDIEQGITFVDSSGEIKKQDFSSMNEQRLSVVQPVLNGKYSQIPDWYINSLIIHPTLKKIHSKDKLIKDYWEICIGNELGEDAEVWPALDLNREKIIN